MNWNEQTAVITGGGDGLGLALAKRLHGFGVRLALMDRDGEKLARVCEEFNAIPLQADVTDEAAVRAAIEKVEAQTGRVDILVNCAGITGKTNVKSQEVELDNFKLVLDINLLGCFLTSKAVLPGMLERGYGRILHIASISGKEGNAGMVAYSCSKAAVIALAKVQGKECANTGVTVNALAPAVIRTEMVAALPPEQVKYMTDKIPAGRCGELEEFAAMASFIVSPENSFTTAFCFDLSGGRATY